MTRCPSDLAALWAAVHQRPGWLHRVSEALGMDADDKAYLCDLDEAWIAARRSLEEQWNQGLAERGATLSREVAKASPEWVRERRREYVADQVADLEAQLGRVYAEYAEVAKDDGEYVERLLVLKCADAAGLEQRLKRLKAELPSLSGSAVSSSRLTADQIERAKARPLESVLSEQPERGYIPCPVHLERTGKPDRHPSMLVKNGYGYCFSCGGSLDALGYLTKARGLSFRAAVEALQ